MTRPWRRASPQTHITKSTTTSIVAWWYPLPRTELVRVVHAQLATLAREYSLRTKLSYDGGGFVHCRFHPPPLLLDHGSIDRHRPSRTSELPPFKNTCHDKRQSLANSRNLSCTPYSFWDLQSIAKTVSTAQFTLQSVKPSNSNGFKFILFYFRTLGSLSRWRICFYFQVSTYLQ